MADSDEFNISTDNEDRAQFAATALSSLPLVGGLISASTNYIIKKRQDKRLSEALNKFANNNIEYCKYIESIPKNEAFIGRNFELETIEDSDSKIIIIEGIPGIGKTYLGSKFALESKINKRVFWHTINELDSTKSILCQLSSFLSQNGFPRAYDFINRGTEDFNYLIDLIISDLEKDNYVLFFDDYHTIKDEQIKVIFEKLKNALKTTTLIVITRPSPLFKFYTEYDFSSGTILRLNLKGFNYNNSKEKLSSLGCKVDESTFLKFYDLTGGYPIALELIALYEKNGYDLETLFGQSSTLPEDLMSYLFNEIFFKLSDGEKQFLKAISVYRSTVNVNAINIFDVENVVENAQKLSDKHLIERNKDLYSAHPIIKNLSYSLIEDKEFFHKTASEYYLLKEVIRPSDIIELQYHLFKATDYFNSALLAMQASESLIRQGFVTPLLDLLQMYKQEMLLPELWIYIGTIIGQLHFIKHDLDNAEAKFLEMLTLSYSLNYDNGISSLLNNLSLIYVYKEDVPKSLELQLKSLELYESQSDLKGKIAVLVNIGNSYLELGNLDKACSYAKQALNELENNNYPDVELVLLNLLGSIYKEYENWDKAIIMFEKSKKIATIIGDYSGIANACASLGNIYADRGQLDKAEYEYSCEIEAAEHTEQITSLESAYGNYASLLTNKKEFDKSNEFYEKSLNLSIDYGLSRNIATNYLNNAVNHYYKDNLTDALKNCKLAIKYAKKKDFKNELAASLLILGAIQEKRCENKNILGLYKKSISLYEATNNNFAKAFAYNQLGKFYEDKNNLIEAIKYYNLSLDLFIRFNSTINCLKVCENCVTAYEKLYDSDQIISLYERIIHYLIDLCDNENLSIAYSKIIEQYLKVKQWEKLEIACNEKIKIDIELNENEELSHTYYFLAIALRHENKYSTSLEKHKAAIKIAENLEDYPLVSKFTNDMATTYLFAGNQEEAEKNYLKSIEMKKEIGDEIGIMQTYHNLGTLYAINGDLQKGIDYLEIVENFYFMRNNLNQTNQIFQRILTIILSDPKEILHNLTAISFPE